MGLFDPPCTHYDSILLLHSFIAKYCFSRPPPHPALHILCIPHPALRIILIPPSVHKLRVSQKLLLSAPTHRNFKTPDNFGWPIIPPQNTHLFQFFREPVCVQTRPNISRAWIFLPLRRRSLCCDKMASQPRR